MITTTETNSPHAATNIKTTRRPIARYDTALGQIIKARRIELKLSQLDLAIEVGGKSGEFISMIETGVRMPEMDRIPRFAAALSLDGPELVRIFLNQVHPLAYGTLFPNLPDPSEVGRLDDEDMVLSFQNEDVEILQMINSFDSEGKTILRNFLTYMKDNKPRRRVV